MFSRTWLRVHYGTPASLFQHYNLISSFTHVQVGELVFCVIVRPLLKPEERICLLIWVLLLHCHVDRKQRYDIEVKKKNVKSYPHFSKQLNKMPFYLTFPVKAIPAFVATNWPMWFNKSGSIDKVKGVISNFMYRAAGLNSELHLLKKSTSCYVRLMSRLE